MNVTCEPVTADQCGRAGGVKSKYILWGGRPCVSETPSRFDSCAQFPSRWFACCVPFFLVRRRLLSMVVAAVDMGVLEADILAVDIPEAATPACTPALLVRAIRAGIFTG